MLACVLGYPLDCIRADLNGALHLYRVLLPSAPCYVRLLELRILQGLRTVHQRRKKLRLREMMTYVDHKATLFTAYLSAQSSFESAGLTRQPRRRPPAGQRSYSACYTKGCWQMHSELVVSFRTLQPALKAV